MVANILTLQFQKEPASKKQKVKVKSVDLPIIASVPALSKDVLNKLFEKEVINSITNTLIDTC